MQREHTAPRRVTVRPSITAWACAVSLLAPLAGCMTVSMNPAYPPDWSSLSMQRTGPCPSIAGRYLNQGQLYLEGPGCSWSPNSQTGWDCSLLLTRNLGVEGDGSIVSLTQPDGDTLTVAVPDEEGTRQDTHVLHRGAEFQCDADSLYFSDAQSMVPGGMMTALGILTLTGGVEMHSRAFVRNEAGELVMTVRQRMAAYHLVFGFSGSGTNYVRWPPAPEPGRESP